MYLDQGFLKECRANQGDDSSFIKDGSTASVVLIVDSVMYVANVGDSPIMVLNKHNKVSVVSEEHGTANKHECERIIEAGARLVYQQGLRPSPFPF